MTLTRRERIIMNEAFIIGRVYCAMGEKETPSEISDVLEKKCEFLADNDETNNG